MRGRWRLAGVLAMAAQAMALPPPAAVRLEGAGPYYTLELPLAWQVRAGTADLRGLRLRNAQGERLSHAWVDEAPAPASLSTVGVPVLRWKAPTPDTPAPRPGVPDDAPRGWVLDLRGVQGAVVEVALSLAADANAVYPVAVEASDDLSRWRVLRPDVQLVALQHQGQRLDSSTVELDGVSARYLRLRSLGRGAVPPLTGAEVTASSRHVAPPALQWSEPLAPTGCDVQQCDYALPAVALQAVELLPREANAVARVAWLAQGEAPPATAPSHPHHRLRHPLRALRDKSPAPLPAPDPGWWPVAQGSVWWLRLPQGESRSPMQAFDGAVHGRLRVQVAGGVAQLGAQPPQLRYAVRPRTLVLLARGSGPYRLEAVDPAQAPPTMSLAELMPTQRPGEALPADRAILQADVAPVQSAASSAAPAPAAAATAPDTRRLWLWAALLAGVALMAGMAWSLLRGRPNHADTAATPRNPLSDTGAE